LELDFSRADYGHEIMAQHYRSVDDQEGAIRHYQKALQVSENIRYRLNIAAAYAKLRRFQESERWYQGAIALDSNSATAHAGLALILQDALRASDALIHARRAHALTPSDPDYAYLVGVSLVQLFRPEEGLPFLEQAAKATPREAMHLNALGVCYLMLDRAAEARAALEAALRRDSSEPSIWLNGARAALRDGDRTEARRLLSGYEDLVPEGRRHPEAARMADSLAHEPRPG
jgi:tetratricopeptide (TPR) repeat protein